MNDPRPNGELPEEMWAMRVREIAQKFDFPPTPEVARAVQQRLVRPHRRVTLARAARAAAVLAILALILLLAIPDLRARALDWLGLGAVRIVREPPPVNVTPLPFSEWADEMALEDAQTKVSFPIRLPAELEPPDRVFVGDVRGQIVILVWERADAPLMLYEIGPGASVTKYIEVESEMITQVNGGRALWMVRPHLYEMAAPGREPVRRIVEHNALVWETEGVTYRLETALPLDDAKRIAESLR